MLCGSRQQKNECRPGCARPSGTAAFPFGRQRGPFRQFEEEKRLFPESGVFMDFLMKTGKGGKR
ncbi:DUF4810 domain-containing protein [Neisseria meningitidis]|nr:DUF4810 domain-containing protein [Neisseria meningitidis]